jgi:hypothetical protein
MAIVADCSRSAGRELGQNAARDTPYFNLLRITEWLRLYSSSAVGVVSLARGAVNRSAQARCEQGSWRRLLHVLGMADVRLAA